MKGIKNMEINKQLFKDVLSGKLKGTFVLRSGEKIPSGALRLHRLYYGLCIEGRLYLYYDNGRYACCSETLADIIDFIPDTNMKENELTIEIPEGKIVDWDESKKQNKIVLKDKQLTYKDVCEKLFKDDHYTIAWEGSTIRGCSAIYNASNATTQHQLECILAKNKLANVAKYLNDGWKPTNMEDAVYYLTMDLGSRIFVGSCSKLGGYYFGKIMFKSGGLAKQAIEILGEETVKLALEPLGI